MKLSKVLLLGLVLALGALLAIPAIAQEVGPGEGGPAILPNFGADVATTNPILVTDGTSSNIINLIYPGFLGVNEATAAIDVNVPGNLVTAIDISDDGLVYTFTLRDDFVWSDGVPVTSADLVYVWDVIKDEETDVLVNSNLVDFRDKVASVEGPDPNTVVITFKEAACNAIDVAAVLQPIPAHHWLELYGEDYALMNESEANLNPQVTGGKFLFLNYRPGEQVTLVANPDYPDGDFGGVIPEGYIDKVVADQTVQVEQFLAGELTAMTVPQSRQDELQALVDAGEYQGVTTERFNIRFIALNEADPENPVNGLDEDGNEIDQGLHPIFADVRVRQALNYGIDYDAINEGVFFGKGYQVPTHSGATNWVDISDIEAYPFDQAKAMELLEEAGWVDADGDGIRECSGCMYATEVDPDFEGSPLAFELLTNAGNVSQEALGNVLVDLWGEIGFDVDFAPIDFNVLVETLTSQTFDAVMIFWGFGFPEDPDGARVTFGPENDIVDAGFNATSYNNPRVTEILDTALVYPGCDKDAREALYHEMYQILRDESPWLWLGGGTGLAVAQPGVQNWRYSNTAGQAMLWNVENWVIIP